MIRFPDIYDTLRLAGNTYFFGIVKMEYRSKNCFLFENVFFVSHVINRRCGPIAKSPIIIICVCIAIIYLYVDITNTIVRLCDPCTHVNFCVFCATRA